MFPLHIIGLYPNAGHDYYIINTPIVDYTCINLDGGKKFEISVPSLSEKNVYIKSVTLNGNDYPYSTLRHQDIVNGGKLVIEVSSEPTNWGKKMFSDK